MDFTNNVAGGRFTIQPPTQGLVKQGQTYAIAQSPSTQEVPRPIFM